MFHKHMDLAEPIAREEAVCHLAVDELKQRCRTFERRYRMSSGKFAKAFEKGLLGDDEPYFEWKALLEGINSWSRIKQSLKKLHH
jgi:hypothetical protein